MSNAQENSQQGYDLAMASPDPLRAFVVGLIERVAHLESRIAGAKDLLDSCAQGIVPDSRIRQWEAEVGEVKEEV